MLLLNYDATLFIFPSLFLIPPAELVIDYSCLLIADKSLEVSLISREPLYSLDLMTGGVPIEPSIVSLYDPGTYEGILKNCF
jgi:hypothetical protein